jgi:hypothetical protein
MSLLPVVFGLGEIEAAAKTSDPSTIKMRYGTVGLGPRPPKKLLSRSGRSLLSNNHAATNERLP